MLVSLLFLLATFGFYLFYLLPIKFNTVHFYFFDDLIARFSKDIRRLALPSEQLAIAMHLWFRLLSFNMIFFPVRTKSGLLAIDPSCSGAFASSYERS